MTFDIFRFFKCNLKSVKVFMLLLSRHLEIVIVITCLLQLPIHLAGLPHLTNLAQVQ